MNLEQALRDAERKFDRHNLPRILPGILQSMALASTIFDDEGISLVAATSALLPNIEPRLILKDYLGSLPSNPSAENFIGMFPILRSSAQKMNSKKLLHEATQELLKRGFKSFSFLDNGGSAIILKGKSDAGQYTVQGQTVRQAYAALRFVSHQQLRLSSNAILPAEPVLLPYEHQIEILPFASSRFVKSGIPDVDKAGESRWNERLLYSVSLLHAEGKFAWHARNLNNLNIVEWRKSIWISDPDRIREVPNARPINEDSMRNLLTEDVPHLVRGKGIKATEYQAVVAGYSMRATETIKQWGDSEAVHVISLPNFKKNKRSVEKEVVLVTDPSRKKVGPELLEGVRKALKSQAPAF